MEVTNNYYRVRNSYATTVTPVSKVKPVVNEKSVTNLIATSKVNDSVSISNKGRTYVNGLSEVPKEFQVEAINEQEVAVSSIVEEKQYTSIDDVRLALGMKNTTPVETPITRPTSQEPMTMRKRMALSAYQKIMSYAPKAVSGSYVQGLV